MLAGSSQWLKAGRAACQHEMKGLDPGSLRAPVYGHACEDGKGFQHLPLPLIHIDTGHIQHVTQTITHKG